VFDVPFRVPACAHDDGRRITMVTMADILLGGILPGIVAVAALAGVWKLTHNAASSWRTAAVLSFLVGMWALDAQGVGVVSAIAKSMRITEARDFLPLMVILAVIPDAVAASGKQGAILGWIMRAGLCVFVPWRLLWGSRYLPKVAPPPNFDTGAWGPLEATCWIGGAAAAMLTVWAMVRAENTEAPRLRSVLAALVAFAASATTAYSGSLTLGQLLGVLVATLMGCALAAWLMKVGRGPDAAAGPIVIALGGVLVLAHFFAELKLLHAVLLLAGLTVGAGLFFPGKKWSMPVRCAVCLLAIGVAVGMARIEFAAAQAEAGNNPYLNM
jgi:hypothetical protein